MRVDGLVDNYNCKLNTDNTELTIYLAPEATCKELILEVLPYILPAGIIFNILYYGVTINNTVEIKDTFEYSDKVQIVTSTATNRFTKLNDEDSITAVTSPSTFTIVEDADSNKIPIIKPNLAKTMRLMLPDIVEVETSVINEEDICQD
jgi:hypothetical protein